jgi:hypothetical protein
MVTKNINIVFARCNSNLNKTCKKITLDDNSLDINTDFTDFIIVNSNNIVMYISFPKLINNDIAYLFGYIMACCNIENIHNIHMDISILQNEKIKKILEYYFQIVTNITYFPQYFKYLYDFLKYFDVDSNNIIPKCIINNNISIQKNFIKGFLNGSDINNNNNNYIFNFKMVKIKLLEDLQIFMLNIGILSIRNLNKLYINKDNYKSLFYTSFNNIDVFTDKILSIQEILSMTYNLEIINNENYIGNGFINHIY